MDKSIFICTKTKFLDQKDKDNEEVKFERERKRKRDWREKYLLTFKEILIIIMIHRHMNKPTVNILANSASTNLLGEEGKRNKYILKIGKKKRSLMLRREEIKTLEYRVRKKF